MVKEFIAFPDKVLPNLTINLSEWCGSGFGFNPNLLMKTGHKSCNNSNETTGRWWLYPLLALSVNLAALLPAQGQSFNLSEYLPYSGSITSTLSSSLGFTLEIAGDNATNFHWKASHPVEEGLKQEFRLTGAGLAHLTEAGLEAGTGLIVYTQAYSPIWLVAPATIVSGQIINSSANHTGYDTVAAGAYAGTNQAKLTVGTLESVTTPAGTFEALKVTAVNSWGEAGGGYTITGMTTQTWWMVQGLGIVRLYYGKEETYTEPGFPPETGASEITFNLETHSLLGRAKIRPNLLNATTLRLSWDSLPGWNYQLQVATNLVNWSNATNTAVVGTGNTLSLDVPINLPRAYFRLHVGQSSP